MVKGVKMSQSRNKIALIELLSWCEERNYAGLDPYDLVEKSNALQRLAKPKKELTFIEKVQLFSLNWAKEKFPLCLRKLYRVEEKIHPTAMAGFMAAYLNLYEQGKDSSVLKKANYCRNWLIENRIKKYENYCWGTPFEWISGGVKYELGTPFAVVCVWVGQAFLKSYQLTGNKEDLTILSSISSFLLSSLQMTEFEDDTICFSYSPLKKDLINNANLFVASFLADIYHINKEEHLKIIALQAAKYSIGQQLENGLIPYFGKESSSYSIFNDSYHSSYEIRSLLRIGNKLDFEIATIAAKKYMDYCRTTYFKPTGAIALSKHKQKIVDGTSLAEFMILFGDFPDQIEEDELDKIINYAVDEFQDSEGFFYYKNTDGKIIKTPYMRWIQGWMAWGLSSTLNHE